MCSVARMLMDFSSQPPASSTEESTDGKWCFWQLLTEPNLKGGQKRHLPDPRTVPLTDSKLLLQAMEALKKNQNPNANKLKRKKPERSIKMIFQTV